MKIKKSKTNRTFGEPGNTMLTRNGYVYIYWPEHPLSVMNKQAVCEHHLVYWQESGYDTVIFDWIKRQQISIHHKDEDKQHNDPNNLELRFHHPKGSNIKDLIYVIKLAGYKVIDRDENEV